MEASRRAARIEAANRAVHALATARPELAGMGTTVTLAELDALALLGGVPGAGQQLALLFLRLRGAPAPRQRYRQGQCK